MMKNIYSLGAYQLSAEDFFLDIYYMDPGGGKKRYIPEGTGVNGTPLLKIMNLDRLNNQLDPQPDGIFDFVPNVTISPSNGKIIFPVLEPFGEHLSSVFYLLNRILPKIHVSDSVRFNHNHCPAISSIQSIFY